MGSTLPADPQPGAQRGAFAPSPEHPPTIEDASGSMVRVDREGTSMNQDPVSATGNGARRRRLVVNCGVGAEAAERCHQALTIVATAAASGADASLWLMGDAVHLAVPGGAAAVELPGSAPAQDLFDAVLAAGTVTACTQCLARRGMHAGDLVAGVRVAGAAAFVDEVLGEDATALVF
jgi:predicted peroxiredoxin